MFFEQYLLWIKACWQKFERFVGWYVFETAGSFTAITLIPNDPFSIIAFDFIVEDWHSLQVMRGWIFALKTVKFLLHRIMLCVTCNSLPWRKAF